jgi:hypothetical protein
MSRPDRGRLRSWLGWLALSAAVAGLATAGIAAATVATRSAVPQRGANVRPSCDTCDDTETEPTDTHGDHTDTAPTETTPTTSPPPTTAAPPPPPPPPPSTTSAPPESGVTAAQKKQAITDIRLIMVGTATFLGDCLTPSDTGSNTTDPVLCFVAAQAIFHEMLQLLKVYNDPPDPNFAKVALPSASFRTVQQKCLKRLASRDCASLRAAWLGYWAAVRTAAVASTGLGTSVERFAGAGEAHSVEGAFLQLAAEKAYAGAFATALTAQGAAGRALATTLDRLKLDAKPSASAIQALIKKLSTPSAIPKSVVSQLVASGSTHSAAELAETLAGLLKGLPKTMSLKSALRSSLSTSELNRLYRTLTLSDVQHLLKGLAAQGAISSALSKVLSSDLDEHDVAGFVADAKQFPGPAAHLLAVAGAAIS